MSIAARIFLNNAIGELSLLFGQGRVAAMSKNFRGSSNWSAPLVVLFAAGFLGVAIWLAYQYFNSADEKAFKCPHRLFKDLCRRHGLSWHDASLLKKLALRRQLDSPLEVFVNPAVWDLQGSVMQERVRVQLTTIQQKLFGDAAVE